ncbi:MAG: response regulator transcription factor [Caldilineaceae bacterium]
MSKIRVMLVDDHAMLRAGLQMAVSSQPDMEVVGQASNGREVLEQAQSCRPDVVLMDISLPDVGGAEMTELIRQELPAIRILAFTRHGDPSYLRRMLQAGASGYILKNADASALLQAIRVVAAGGAYIDPVLAGSLVETVINRGGGAGSAQPALSELTSRERDVLRLIAWGRSNKEIATQFGISIKTVEYYKAQATEKLQLHSRTDIVRYALTQGWLRSDQEPE